MDYLKTKQEPCRYYIGRWGVGITGPQTDARTERRRVQAVEGRNYVHERYHKEAIKRQTKAKVAEDIA